jgi:HlyD family secretion protein
LKYQSVRGPVVAGLVTLVVLVGGFGGWSVFSNLAGAIVTSGQLEVDRNRQIVQHLDGGVIAEILVDEGDLVAKGDVLIRLDSAVLESNLVITEGQLFEIIARRGRLVAERDEIDEVRFDPELIEIAKTKPEVADIVAGQNRLFEARRASMDQEVNQLGKRRIQISDQIAGLDAQKAALNTQLELISEELVNQQTLLDKGLAQASRVLSLRREQANLSGRVGGLSADKAQAYGRITEIDIEILKLGTGQREEAITQLRDLQYRELELAENRRATLEQLSRLDITAPVSGIVYGMQVVTPRSVLRAADPVLYLVPQDRPLVIAVQVQPIHVDQIHLGQEVTLRFSAFDQRETPELIGVVTQISADAFRDEGTHVAYYRAEIELTEGEQARLPDNATLIPGMPVEAFIRTADQAPIFYLVKPLTDYFTRAFRES